MNCAPGRQSSGRPQWNLSTKTDRVKRRDAMAITGSRRDQSSSPGVHSYADERSTRQTHQKGREWGRGTVSVRKSGFRYNMEQRRSKTQAGGGEHGKVFSSAQCRMQNQNL